MQSIRPVCHHISGAQTFMWHSIHHWSGLKLSLLLCFIFITGTVATISHELDWLFDGDRRINTAYTSTDYDWDGYHKAAKQARPTWVFEEIHIPTGSYFAVEAIGLTPDGERRRLLINPHTAAVQGEANWLNVQRFTRDMHRRFFIMNDWGTVTVSSLSLLVLLSLISGLMTYKKFWRGYFKKPRNRNRRTLWGDLHRLFGLWSLWFIALIALTGLWYLYEALGDATDHKVADYPLRDISLQTPNITGITAPLKGMIETIQKQAPDYQVKMIKLPLYTDDTIEFHGINKAILTRPRANIFIYDPTQKSFTERIDGQDLTAEQRLAEMADPLHFGTFGGLASKLIYFIFGMLLSAIALSGVYIYSARISKSTQRHAKYPTLKAMGVFKWPAGGIMIYIIFAALPYAENVKNARQISAASNSHIITAALADCQVTAGLIPSDDHQHFKLTLKASPKCLSKFSAPIAQILSADGKIISTAPFKYSSRAMKTKLKTSQDHTPALIKIRIPDSPFGMKIPLEIKQ